MMRRIGTLPRIGDLARRTMEYRDEPHRPDGLRQLADAARCDPWGRAVQLAEVIGRALLALVSQRAFEESPTLAISRQAEVPAAALPKDVPEQFRHLVGEHPDHPGTGAGPRPRSD